jgi:hypothetical protein
MSGSRLRRSDMVDGARSTVAIHAAKARRGASIRAGVIIGVAFALLVAVPGAFAAKPGNSESAKACQKGGWQNLLRADGSSFADEASCTSYAAQGGALYPSSAGPCLGSGYLTKATSGGEPFASAEACIAYLAAAPGQLVTCTRVGTSGDDMLADAGTGEVVCGFGGGDHMLIVGAGATFYGGPGSDSARDVIGTFHAGADIDAVENVIGGTYNGGDGNDGAFYLEAGAVFNGEGGNDTADLHSPTAIFNGGDGDDTGFPSTGTFNGGLGDDLAGTVGDDGRFHGGPGNDRALVVNSGGIFNGDAGADRVSLELGGAGATFNGGDGNDDVETVRSGGVVNGEGGDDRVGLLDSGTFNGGDGTDTVCATAGTFTTTEVEVTGCN